MTDTLGAADTAASPLHPASEESETGRAADLTAALAKRLSGRVVGPGDAGWDTARLAWNLAVDQQPELVVEAAGAEDIVETVRFACREGLWVAPQGTGHNAAALGDLAGTILLRTGRMSEVTVDAAQRRVRAEAGAQWHQVTEALAPHGLIGLAGSSGDVGVAGYLLGGGCSWFSRQHGLANNTITAIEAVTGDGQQRRVDAEHEPDLFWAIRGGGGNAAIVTAIEFTAVPAGDVYAGCLLFPIDRAADVFGAYRQWTPAAPEAANTCVRLLRLPELDDMPPFLRGRALVGVDGVIDLPRGEAEGLLAPLRELDPEIDLFELMPASAVGRIHMDPPGPVPGRGDGMLLRELGPDTVGALLSVAGPRADCPLLAVDIRHIGGAIGRPAPGGGCVDHLPGEFMLYAVGITPVPRATTAVRAALAAVTGTLRPWAAERDYLNFRETPDVADRFYPPAVVDRLRDIGQRYDAQRIIRAGHAWTETSPRHDRDTPAA